MDRGRESGYGHARPDCFDEGPLGVHDHLSAEEVCADGEQGAGELLDGNVAEDAAEHRFGAPRANQFVERGTRIVELFKQPAFSPVPIELQVAILFGMQKNFFDAIDAKKVVAAAASMKEFFATRKDALLTEIRTKAALDKDLEAKLQTACDEWKASFAG